MEDREFDFIFFGFFFLKRRNLFIFRKKRIEPAFFTSLRYVKLRLVLHADTLSVLSSIRFLLIIASGSFWPDNILSI
jgi:hypothetical protein